MRTVSRSFYSIALFASVLMASSPLPAQYIQMPFKLQVIANDPKFGLICKTEFGVGQCSVILKHLRVRIPHSSPPRPPGSGSAGKNYRYYRDGEPRLVEERPWGFYCPPPCRWD